MAEYREKPVVIEAVKWDGSNHREMWDFLTGKSEEYLKASGEHFYIDHEAVPGGLVIKTLEGPLLASIGDISSKAYKVSSTHASLISLHKPMSGQMKRRSKVEKLNTIQKREKLNNVFAVDEPGAAGVNHRYLIESQSCDERGNADVYCVIRLQEGAWKLPDSIHGIIDTDLLEIVRHRLQSFQQGPFATRENACALTHIEEALMWLNRRVEDRIEREVLGTN